MNMQGKTKRLKIKDVSSNIKHEANIGSLNDKCLINIFQYLPLKEKLDIETVCKRWRRLAKYSWTSVTCLDLSYNSLLYQFNTLSEDEKAKNSNFFLNVLSRCSSNLYKLSITPSNYILECSRFLKGLPKYCSNLTHLIIETKNELITDEYLSSLFKITVNLCSISLCRQTIGKCLLDLQSDNIKDFSIESCEFVAKKSFYTFLSKLKNLSKFKISYNESESCNINEVLASLLKSNCENLLEVSVPLGDDEVVPYLKLLTRQKKLSKLELCDFLFNEELFEILPSECLKVLDLKVREESNLEKIINSFKRFKNLETFSCNVCTLNDKFLHAISQCKNIKKIVIGFYQTCAIRQSKAISYFGSLKYLEFFSMSGGCCQEFRIDNILTDLSKSKSLKELKLIKCKYSKSGFQSICSIPNLTSLDINGDYKDYDIIDLIKKSLHLEELKILTVSENLINAAYEIKKQRNDKHNLKLMQYFYKIYRKSSKDLSPYVTIVNEGKSGISKFV